MPELIDQSGLKKAISNEIPRRSQPMRALLELSLRFASISGKEEAFTHTLANWAKEHGFATDLWIGDETEIISRYGPISRHIPLTNRPTLHISLDGDKQSRSILFNGHSDVVDAPEPRRWRFDPWAGTSEGHMVYGRGACDVKGGIIAALWAMLTVKNAIPSHQRGSIGLEIVPGEEDCVGLGTLTSVARGYESDGVIVLEPTNSLPRCASRGGIRFEVIATGRAVHGTVKWLGVDAIGVMQKVLMALTNIEQHWNDRQADRLFSKYPIARSITVDRVNGGDWQGMVCDRCMCAGYLELLPGDDLSQSKVKLQQELSKELHQLGQNPGNVRIEFSEEYRGHMTSPDHPLCAVAQECVQEHRTETKQWEGWQGFNSGCEAGLRANLLGTPTLVWGPGSLDFAHAVDERIDFREVEITAERFAGFMLSWGETKESSC
ncbi:MAG TPA: M20/M25/M40 family metallo-hydrolase [Tepidisphaeraceae bacterium]|jgi:acetylornithine deacetylase